MTTNPAHITVCYPSAEGVTRHHAHFCALVDGVPLPESIADLFTAEVVHKDGRVIVRVDFA
jgi:hypothetical protein